MSVEKINLLPFRRADSFPYEAPGYANSRHEVSGPHQVCNGNGPRADLNQNERRMWIGFCRWMALRYRGVVPTTPGDKLCKPLPRSLPPSARCHRACRLYPWQRSVLAKLLDKRAESGLQGG